jgi:hypothetical protein
VKTASVGDGDEHTIVEIKEVLRLWRDGTPKEQSPGSSRWTHDCAPLRAQPPRAANLSNERQRVPLDRAEHAVARGVLKDQQLDLSPEHRGNVACEHSSHEFSPK